MPAFDRHCCPVHSVRVLSSFSVTDLAGESVRQSVDVIVLGPKLSSISQLMLPEGERNSVSVAVCGAKVPVVFAKDDVDVVVGTVVDVVDAPVVVVVVVVVGDEPLEQAASHKAPLSTSTRGAIRRAVGDRFTQRA